TRAMYLCELNGVRVNAEDNTTMPNEFLAQQIQWREALEDAKGLNAIKTMSVEVARQRETLLKQIEYMLDELNDYTKAADQLRELMVIERLAHESDRRIEEQPQ